MTNENFLGSNKKSQQTAYFAAGCFWGVEHHFSKTEGVESAISGYMGGKVKNPTYEQVCTKETDHLEVVKVIFDEEKTDFEKLAKLFFEIHDPEQKNGQGPDIGSQYLSAIFVINQEQKEISEKLIKELEDKGYNIATQILEAKDSGPEQFWAAEDYHQDYYDKNGKNPYCHIYTKRF